MQLYNNRTAMTKIGWQKNGGLSSEIKEPRRVFRRRSDLTSLRGARISIALTSCGCENNLERLCEAEALINISGEPHSDTALRNYSARLFRSRWR
jgi:hypothetical protein